MKHSFNVIAAVLLSSTLFTQAVAAEERESLSALFTAHNPHKEPVLFFNAALVEKEMDRMEQDGETLNSVQAVKNIIAKKSERHIDDHLAWLLIQGLKQKHTLSVRNLKHHKAYDEKNGACLIHAELKVKKWASPYAAYNNASPKLNWLQYNGKQISLRGLKFSQSHDQIRRFKRLHEGFHCTDPWFRANITSSGGRTNSWQALVSSGEKRLRSEYDIYRAETYADIAGTLKLAQEGNLQAASEAATYRAIKQIEARGMRSAPQLAKMIISKMTDAEVNILTDGWIDDMTFVSAPAFFNYTIPGLLAVRDFIREQGPEKMATMTMENIMDKAREITENTTMSRNEYRGVSYHLWQPVRRYLSITQPHLKDKIAEGIQTFPLTQEQYESGQKALERYKEAVEKAAQHLLPKPKKRTQPGLS